MTDEGVHGDLGDGGAHIVGQRAPPQPFVRAPLPAIAVAVGQSYSRQTVEARDFLARSGDTAYA
jgi:hypothetical protein